MKQHASQASVSTDTAPTLQELLDWPDDALERRLLAFVRRSGVKFRSLEAFEKFGWGCDPMPPIRRIWSHRDGVLVRNSAPFIWDLRAPLLADEALACCSVLLWRRSRAYDARWLGGIETAAIPLVAGVLAVNRAAGGRPMHGFYLRKQRKPDGLRRILEGVPPPRGTSVLLVDDILNKGIAKRRLLDYCRDNALEPAALFVVVDTASRGRKLFERVCPVEALFTKDVVLGTASAMPSRSNDETAIAPVAAGCTVLERRHDERISTEAGEMLREDIELVRLARDTVLFASLSGGEIRPALDADGRGSAGYSPFLGRYAYERGPVFTRISKREIRDGKAFNRLRGCQCIGLLEPEPATIAEMTVRSAVASAMRARKIRTGPAIYHKPVWTSEIGSLSLFVYVVEELVPTKARTVPELLSEGHDVRRWGLIAHCDGYRAVVCGDTDDVADVAQQLTLVCRKLQNREEIRPHDAAALTLTRMKGRWLWDPARPKATYF